MEAVRNREAEVDAVCLQCEELMKGGGDAARGGEKGVRGECEGAAAKCSSHHNGERFIKSSCLGLRLLMGSKLSCWPEGEMPS